MSALNRPPSASSPLEPGREVGRFTIVREIGRGGMCHVYEARHKDLHKTVAVKVLKPDLAERPALVERFLREGRAASRVRHRHAIDMMDVGVEDGVVYLAMEHLDGEDLAQRIKREGALPFTEAVDLVLPVMAAVTEAHDAGVVHRDLKPANIFLARSRRGAVEPKVLDFGISKVADDEDDSHLTASDAMIGTPCFMAPEQVRGARNASPASDQYALGVILYQCVTGKLPYRGATAFATFERIVRGEYTRPREHVPALPEGLDAVIVRALSPEVSGRFGSVAEMGAALLPFASEAARALWSSTFAPAPPPGVTPTSLPAEVSPSVGTLTGTPGELDAKSPPRASQRPLALGVAATIGALAVGALALVWSQRGRVRETPPQAALSVPVSPVVRELPPAPAEVLDAGAPGLASPASAIDPVAPVAARERRHRASHHRASSRRAPASPGVERDRSGTLLIH